MGYKVVLTCDRTMASHHHGLMFLGFSACIPHNKFADWLYYPVFCPSEKVDKEGKLFYANYGMRKIEAALLDNGFSADDVAVVHPDHINRVVDSDTKIISISSNDPLGIGPATSTFVELWGGEGRMAIKLRELLHCKAVMKHKPTVFLGGPGSWQLDVHRDKMKELGVHHVVIGEGDVTAPKLFKKVMENKGSEIDEVTIGEIAQDKDIADIVNGSTIGIIETTRGCARSCAFCVPSLKKVRSRPIENIINEVKVNIKAGCDGVILHGEDILLYKSDGLRVNTEGVTELFRKVYEVDGVNWVGTSHSSLSSAAYAPEAVENIARVLELGTKAHPVGYFQVGIETASPRLIEKHMKGKVFPFKPAEWPDVIRKGFKVCHDNHFICSATIILGLPGEEREDIEMTTELVRSLNQYQSIFVPLLFTPMATTRLEYANPLLKKDLTPQHHELITACWDHNFNWLPTIWGYYSRNSNLFVRHFINMMMKFGINPVRKRMYKNARKHGANI